MSEIHDQVNDTLRQAWGLDAGDGYPPPLHQTLQLKWTAYEPKRLLHADCVFPDSWASVAGIESGCLNAAFEIVAGAFASLLAHKRCMTLTMECTALRQLRGAGEPILVEVQLRATRKAIVFVEGTLRDQERQVLANASATFAARKGDKRDGGE